MDSPWCGSASSEVFPLSVSEDSGLLLSAGSGLLIMEVSTMPASGRTLSQCGATCVGGVLQQQDSDDNDDKSSLLDDSVAYSDHYNTLKKAPCWPDTPPAIKPPPEFQDTSASNSPVREPRPFPDAFPEWLEKMAARIVSEVLEEALSVSWCRRRRRMFPPCWLPGLLSLPSLPGSRSSLSSRLSSSHNSLSVPMANRADDSSFITSAMSHDVLSMADISDMYNVPLDCDVYAVPVDMLRPSAPVPPDRPKRHRHRRQRPSRYLDSPLPLALDRPPMPIVIPTAKRPGPGPGLGRGPSRGPGRSASMECTTPVAVAVAVEPIHMTLQEVRRYLHNLYSSSSDSSECLKKRTRPQAHAGHNGHSTVRKSAEDKAADAVSVCRNNSQTHRKNTNTHSINGKNKKAKDVCSSSVSSPDCLVIPDKPKKQASRGFNLTLSLKQTFCNIFRFGRMVSPEKCVSRSEESKSGGSSGGGAGAGTSPPAKSHFSKRALPPLPAREGAGGAGGVGGGSTGPLPSPSPTPEDSAMVQDLAADDEQEPSVDFASSIEKVKDYGWYWGPISGEAAEKILSTEPDGSFIVRDSSDDHYIFSLTFKLNSCVRHVRIEQDQGNFSFGSCAKFKSHTIVDFIENAVEHSRSGRYLFFLHRRPVLGPMRVQLLHPVSRFKQVQSLQHMCRFVILKVVRRDLIATLPLPRRVIDYLSTPHYYSEQLAEEAANRAPSPSLGDNGLFPYMAPNMAPNIAPNMAPNTAPNTAPNMAPNLA